MYKSVSDSSKKLMGKHLEYKLKNTPTQKNFVRDMGSCSTTLFQRKRYIVVCYICTSRHSLAWGTVSIIKSADSATLYSFCKKNNWTIT